jgi:hypothetical protein
MDGSCRQGGSWWPTSLTKFPPLYPLRPILTVNLTARTRDLSQRISELFSSMNWWHRISNCFFFLSLVFNFLSFLTMTIITNY